MSSEHKIPVKNIVCLLLADLIWGAAFVAQRVGGDLVGAYTFNCIRFLLGALVIFPFAAKRPKKRSNDKTLIIGGIVSGTVLMLASNLQQVGITLGASVGKAGFLTACYILMVPIIGLFLGKKCHWNVAVGVVIAVVGLYFLCMKDGNMSFAKADILLLLCALAFAIQILAIDHFSPLVDVVKLSCLQFFVCGLLSGIPMFFVDMNHSLSGIAQWALAFSSRDLWISILYAGVCSSGIAYTLQAVGQRNFNPTVASLIMSLESVFSVIFGWLLLHEELTMREGVGCILIFSAVILAQISFVRKKI